MKFKYFKITEKHAIDHVERIAESKHENRKAAQALAKELGARQIMQYTNGSVAGFHFDEEPDRAIWKKAGRTRGFMPKVKTREAKMVEDIPKHLEYEHAVKRYGFGGELLIGEDTGRGFEMHSSYLKGKIGSGFYVIVVPYMGKFDRDVHASLLELEEWEVVKALAS